jgi:predicted regulator of Ras-like GTPase activity (Roadblock/LC7/MglB family)
MNSAARRKKARSARLAKTETILLGAAQKKESKVAVNIKGLTEIGGFIGACLVDSETGLMMASEGGGSLDLDAAGAANAEVVKAKLNAIKLLNLKDHIDDILITLGKQFHLIRPLEKTPSIFIYVALDRKAANLGMARVQVKNVEQTLSI